MKTLWMLGAMVGLAVALYALPAAADINPIGNPVITPNGSNFTWTTTLATDAAEHVDTAVNAAFFTAYDVPGLIPGSASCIPLVVTVSCVASTPATGQTPVGITPLPVDDPAIPNISVALTGTVPVSTPFITVSFVDGAGLADGPNTEFAAQATNITTGAREFNASFIETPTPEPATFALLAPSLLGLAWWRRRR